MTDVLFGKIFLRKYSHLIVKYLVKTRVTPNQVTFVSFLLAVLGSFFFIWGTWANLIVGALVWLVSELLDFVDGDLARAKKMVSISGKLCDIIGDTLKKPLIIASLSYGYFALHNAPIALLLGMLAITNIFLIEVLRSYIAEVTNDRKPIWKVRKTVFGMLDTIVIIVLFGALANQLFVVLVLLAFVPIIIWAKKVHEALKIIAAKKA